MAQAISKYPENQREMVAVRRVSSKTYGIGFWSAYFWLVRNGVDPERILNSKGK